MKTMTLALFLLGALTGWGINTVSEDQMKDWYPRYSKQANAPDPEEMLLNTAPEPADLETGFVELYNGRNLDGWVVRGGEHLFEAKGEWIQAICVPGSPSTYLTTVKDDYTDFIFTCEVKYVVDANTGIQFRSGVRTEDGKEVVYGPQFEMEEESRIRGWSGGIYGQSCGGYWYPLWLDAHKAVREAVDYDNWNRVTIYARGDLLMTWINGIPAGKVILDEFPSGFFALQSHSGKQGTILFRGMRVKELPSD
ncbi:MAG: DUF1080 domain-containing protein [Puniceicoccaceae bacterium]